MYVSKRKGIGSCVNNILRVKLNTIHKSPATHLIKALTSAVSSGVVLETDGQTVALQLVRVGRGDALVVGQVRGEDLAHNITVGEAHDKSAHTNT